MTDRVGFAGDWHGNVLWATGRVREFADAGVADVFHAGDFGIWPGGDKFLRRVNDACVDRGVSLWVTLGNHEDYDRVARMEADEAGWLFLPGFEGLRFAPRGHVWARDGVLFGSLGGAGSIDVKGRVPGRSWWPGEQVLPEDVRALTDAVAGATCGRLDVLVTHDAPAGLHRPGKMWAPPEVLHYCWLQRVLLRDACDVVRPWSLVHGHWHDWFEDTLEGDGYASSVWGLPEDGQPRNCVTAVPVPGVGLTEVRPLSGPVRD